jgi:hypothetical protein
VTQVLRTTEDCNLICLLGEALEGEDILIGTHPRNSFTEVDCYTTNGAGSPGPTQLGCVG